MLTNIGNEEFVGWSTNPITGKDVVYTNESDLPPVTADINYYAVFTAPAYFYFVLPGKSNTSTDPKDYMYSGKGKIVVPDGFSGRWYSSQYDLGKYILEQPADEFIREGLATYYDGRNGREKYTSDWTYAIDWTTFTTEDSSVGYDYKVIDNKEAFHVDFSVTIDYNDKATLLYTIHNPDGSTTAQSQVHFKGDQVEINSTVKETEEFKTDEYTYKPVENYKNINYTFDGWYIDQTFTTKAPDRIIVSQSENYYARYVGIPLKLTYNADGGTFSDGDSADKVITAVGGSNVTLITAPTKAGYNFAGWKRSDNESDLAANATAFKMPGQDLVLTAKWEKDRDQWKNISYLSGTDDPVANMPENVHDVIVGSKQTVSDLQPTRAGYLFIGWKSEQVEVTSGTFTMPEVDVTFEAQWIRNTYNISYEGIDGATWSGKNDNPNPDSYITGKSKITLIPPEKENTTFIGWNFSSENADVQVDISDPVNAVILLNSQGDIVFTACWATLTAEGWEGNYDGQSHEIKATIDAEGYELWYNVSGTNEWTTNVPSVVNVADSPLYVNVEARKAGYATLRKDNILLKVNPKGLEVDDPGKFIYNGLEQKWIPTVKDGENLLTEGTDYTVSYRETDDFINVTNIDLAVTITGIGNYGGEIVRIYSITPAPLTVMTEGGSKVYDGGALTNQNITVNGFVNGEEKLVKYYTTGIQTDEGSSKNEYIIEWNNEVKSGNYNIIEQLGDLVVSRKNIEPDPEKPDESTLVVEDIEDKVYNGVEQKISPVVKNGDTILKENTDYTVSYPSGDYKNAGEEVQVIITGTGNYEGKIVRTYKVTRAPLEITTGSATATYNGEPVTNSQVIVEGLVNDETVDIITTGSQTVVGESDNSYNIKWESEKTTALESNYEIKKVTLGKLKVINASYTIEVKGYTGTYDGDPHGIMIDAPADARIEYRLSDVNGEEINNQFIDVTESEITVCYAVIRPNYETITGASTVNISPAPLIVETKGGIKVYDGKALTNSEMDVIGFVKGEKEKVTYNATGSQTEVGEKLNTYNIVWNNINQKNYIVATENLGMLRVTAKSLIPDPDNPENTMQVSESQNVRYDGDKHKWEPDVKDGNKTLIPGTDYDVIYSTDNFTDVTGDIIVTIKGKGNYEGNVTKTYQIVKATLTIKTGGAIKVYNGEALTNSEIEVTGIVDKDKGKGFEYKTIGSQTEVGGSKNTYKITWGQVEKNNYEIKADLGTLEVKARNLNPDPENPEDALSISEPGKYTYNGNPHKWVPEVSDGDTKLVFGTDYDVTYSTDNFTDVTGNITVTIVGKGNYEGTVTKTYEIEPTKLTLVSADLSQVYNGKTLSNGTTALYLEEGWVSGESAPYNFTGSQFYVGSSENTFEILWNNEKATAKKNNYTVQITPGKLEVTTVKDDQEIDPNLVVTKKHIRTATYKVGDVITFTIRVKNVFDETKTVKVTEQSGVTIIGEDSAVLASGDITEFEAQYTVKDEDVVKGTFTNTVTVNFEDVIITNTDEVTEFVKPVAKLSITKDAIGDTEYKAPYGYDETVIYGIRVFNEGTLTLTNVQVEDELTGDNWTIPSLAPGELSDPLETSYTVNDMDILEGSVVVNTATATGNYEGSDDPAEATATETVQTVAPYSHITLSKETTSTPANGSSYALGETITYEIRATNDGNQRLTDIEITDALTGDSWIVAKLAQNESILVGTASHTVTEADVRAGEVKNVVTATAKTPDPDGVTVKDGEKVVPVVKPEPSLSVIKTITPEKEGGYGLGDAVSYEVDVVNNGNLTVNNITVTDELTGDEWKIDSLDPEASWSGETAYTVTEADILAGTVVNKADASGTASNGAEVTASGDVTAGTEAKNGSLALSKRTISEPANGESYVLGETIIYGITATNNGNLTLTDISITDALTGGEWTINSLAPGADSEEYRTTHIVTEADILAGSVVNEVAATGTSPDPDKTEPDVTPDDVENPTESPNGHLTLSKTTTSTPTNGTAYVLGETITYQIVATNDGNLTLTNVVVTDELTGGRWTIANIAPGQKSTVMETSYVVTEADILNGSVVNEATAVGVSPDPEKPEPGVTLGDVTDPTETRSGHLTLTKETTSTPANGSTYALGETVTYEIRAINDGNLTLTNVEVKDELTGDRWVIEEIKPGQRSTAMTTSYVVTEADILAGGIKNVATAAGVSPDPDEPEVPVDPGEKEVPTSVTGASLFVEKTASASADGGTYGLGETVTYTITVTNNGNVTVNNIDVDDPLTGQSWMIRSLAPGAAQSFTTTYTVTEADIQRGQIVNTATAAGTDPSGNPVTGNGSRTITSDPVNTNLIVDKTVIDPKSQYNIGDKIHYRIEVANRGNIALHNVRVTDTMSGVGRSVVFTDLGGGTLNNNVVVFAEIPVGETRTILCEYTVVRADAGAQTPITNRADASSDEGRDNTPSDITPVTPVETAYTLTIHYTNTRGVTMAPDYVGQYVEGEQFHIVSPRIRGYRANYSAIDSSANGMPANDLTYTVIYRRNNNDNGSSSSGSTSDPAPTPGPAPGGGDPAPGTDNPPADGTTPAGTTVPQAADTVETAEDTEEPVGVIVPNEEGGYDLVPSEDTDVPLAQLPSGEGTIADIIHECCALHFLLMLICMLILALYTWDSKKLQASIFDLRDQLGGGRENRR